MQQSAALREELMLERQRLAAKLRATRAILNLSQMELGVRVDLTQRSIYRLEQAQVDAKRATIRILERFWQAIGIGFEDLPDGGFTISIRAAALSEDASAHPIQPKLDRFTAFPARIPT